MPALAFGSPQVRLLRQPDEVATQVSPSHYTLAESEARFRLMVDAAPVMIWMCGPDMHCNYVNKAWLRFTGRTLEQEQGDGWTHGVHPDDLKECLNASSQALEPMRPFVREYRLRRHDGNYGRIEDRGEPCFDADGSFAGYVGSSIEVTARWRAETTREVLLQLASKLGASLNPQDAARTIFAAADQLWAWDAGVLDIYSPAENITQTVLGLDIVDGQRCEIDVNPPGEPPPRTCRVLKQGAELTLRQPPYTAPDSLRFGDTARLSASIMAVPVRWHGEAVGVLSIQSYTPFAFNEDDLRVLQGLADECGGALQRIRDATERKTLEEQIRRSQKLEAVGQLAAGIAHDFNNILASVLGNSQLALLEKGLSPSVGECLAEIEKAAVRARGLIQQILTFSRQQPHERKVLSLEPIVHEVVALLRATIPSKVEIKVSIENHAPLVLADATQVHQVLVNLCTNSWHAFEDKPGLIEVKLQAVTVDSVAARRLEGLKSGRYARLSVSDNGKGMDAQTLKHIFEPFFTTKERGKGTGLGLSVVHGIVQKHEGVVTVSSQPGQGTTFEVYFPQAKPPAKPDGARRPGQGQSVLYLDDSSPSALRG